MASVPEKRIYRSGRAMGMLPMPEGSVEEQPAFAMRGTTQVFWVVKASLEES